MSEHPTVAAGKQSIAIETTDPTGVPVLDAPLPVA
jgi:hypothetical protein